MKKKTAKKHYSLLYKASAVSQTYCESNEWPAPLDSFKIVTIKKCKKHLNKKQLLRLLSDRKAVYKLCEDMNVEYPKLDMIIDLIKHYDLYKDTNRFYIILMNDIFAIGHKDQ